MYVFIHSALAEFPVCTDAGGPELGRALRIHSLVEWLKVSLFTCGALCRMPREQAQHREELYVPRRMVLDGVGRRHSCGDMCELDPEGQVGYREAEREGRTLQMGRVA